MKPNLKHTDFLQDDLFIYWRIYPNKELDLFWEEYLQKKRHLREAFDRAVIEFDAIRAENGDEKLHMEREEREDLFKRVQARVENERKQRTRRLYFTSSVAAILLIMLISTLFFINRDDREVVEMSSIGKVMEENSVTLLSGNNVLNMDNNSELHLSGSRAVVRDSSSRKEIDLEKDQINKLIVPFGKRSSIFLADGSKVYLNSGTEMEFPASFTTDSREISVKGEVFVEVATGTKPFIIHTPNSRIRVYGTSFNVSAYADEEMESVVLVNGSVQVASMSSALKLEPNQMAEVTNGIITRHDVDVMEYISWKNGFMQLNQTPLDDVLTKIGRYYNTEFVYNADLNLTDRTCSGKLFLSDNFNDVLEAFSKMTYLEYKRMEDGRIEVSN